MSQKMLKNQSLERRLPRQERALYKVELILEATMRLLESSDVESLTTNAIAETAGVSIGTVYQYFGDKQAILHALAQREMDGLRTRVMKAVSQAQAASLDERVRMIVHAVLKTYGGRRGVHRALLEHALTRGTGTRLNPLYTLIASQLEQEPAATASTGTANARTRRMSPAQAFVLTHAVAGVMRGLVASREQALKQSDVERELTCLIAGFIEHCE
jgi:AcrR family transcriptional regulator